VKKKQKKNNKKTEEENKVSEYDFRITFLMVRENQVDLELNGNHQLQVSDNEII
jgi:hypothetical protein